MSEGWFLFFGFSFLVMLGWIIWCLMDIRHEVWRMHKNLQADLLRLQIVGQDQVEAIHTMRRVLSR